MALSRHRGRPLSLALVLLAALLGAVVSPASARDKVADQLDDVRKDLRQQQAKEQERAERVEKLLDEIRALDSRLLKSGRNRTSLEGEETELEEEYRLHVERLARRVTQSVFVIHGERDSFVPTRLGRALHRRLPRRGKGAATRPDTRYHSRIARFLTNAFQQNERREP